MILSFKEKFTDGTLTDFEKKILDGVKIHSLRENKNKRWRSGVKIQHAVGMRTKKYRCFKDDTFCTAVLNVFIHNNNRKGQGVCFIYDSGVRRFLTIEEETQFAINDGFKNRFDFFKFFSTDKYLTLIHWTDAHATGIYKEEVR